MMRADPEMQPVMTKRRSWLPFIIIGSVVLLAIAWSLLWINLRDRANERFDRFLAEQAATGQAWQCVDRQNGGYPFHLDIRCASVNGLIKSANGQQYQIAAGAFTIVARAYAPGHVIATLDGPATLADANSNVLARGNWQSLRASAKTDGRIVKAIDIAAEGIAGDAPGFAHLPGLTNSFKAELLGLHGRVVEHQETSANIDLAASAGAFAFSPEGRPTTPLDMQLRATALNTPIKRSADPVGDFAAANGKLRIDQLLLTQSDAAVQINGTLALDPAFRPAGALQLAARGNDLNTPGVQGAFGGVLPMLALALRLTGRPAQIAGEPARAADLVLQNGEIRFGNMTLGEVPPLR